MNALEAISSRRSSSRLLPPALERDHLKILLEAALAAPDHGHLRPFRFVVLESDAKDRLGIVLRDAYLARCAENGITPDAARAEKEVTKLDRAPTVVVAAAIRRRDPKIPWQEQRAAVAAAIQNMLIAATALGYGSMWRTGDPAYDPRVKEALGLAPDDAIVGFVYLGHLAEPLTPRSIGPDLYEESVHVATAAELD